MMLFSTQITTLFLSSILLSFDAVLIRTMLIILPSITYSVYGFNTNHISLVNNNRQFRSLSAVTNNLSSKNNHKCCYSINVIWNNRNRNSITSLSALPDIEGEVITDTAIALCDYATFLPDMKTSKLRIKYAQVIGRILFIDVSLLPGHTFHPEELAIQLFLLGGSIQPIIRSIQLFRCRRTADCRDVEECALDYDDDLGSDYDDDCELTYTFIDIENKKDNNDDHDMDAFE